MRWTARASLAGSKRRDDYSSEHQTRTLHSVRALPYRYAGRAFAGVDPNYDHGFWSFGSLRLNGNIIKLMKFFTSSTLYPRRKVSDDYLGTVS